MAVLWVLGALFLGLVAVCEWARRTKARIRGSIGQSAARWPLPDHPLD